MSYLTRKLSRNNLIPNASLKRLSKTEWESVDNDPWFQLKRHFKSGHYELNINAFSEFTQFGSTPMRVYYSDVSGTFGEKNFVQLPPLPTSQEPHERTHFFHLPHDTDSLRFDPLESPGKFHLLGFHITQSSVANRTANPDVRYQLVPDSLQLQQNLIPISFDVRPSESRPHLNILIPAMCISSMSAGPNCAINLTLRLASEGLPVRFISTDSNKDDNEALWKHFHRLTGTKSWRPNVDVVNASDRSVSPIIGEKDIFFGTAWWTTHLIRHALHRMKARKFIYMIQDFEPGLYPWSSLYALALETYGMNFDAVINESLLKEYLVANSIGRFADPDFVNCCLLFEPAIDRTKFYPSLVAPISRRKRLLLYARPIGAPRNLYELSIVALKRAVSAGAFPPDEWDLKFIGEQLPPAQLGNGVVVNPIDWLDYESYADLLRSSDVGISLMLSPHTGFPTLEMASCGMIAVTNTYSVKTAGRLRSFSKNIIPVAPSLDSIVEGLMDAYVRASDTEARIADSAVGLPDNWDKALNPLVPKLRKLIDACTSS